MKNSSEIMAVFLIDDYGYVNSENQLRLKFFENVECKIWTDYYNFIIKPSSRPKYKEPILGRKFCG